MKGFSKQSIKIKGADHMKIRAHVPSVSVLFVLVLLTVILFSALAAEATNLSKHGDLVWYGSDGNDDEIFLYSKGSPKAPPGPLPGKKRSR